MGNLLQEKKMVTVREGSQDSSDAPYVKALGEVGDLRINLEKRRYLL